LIRALNELARTHSVVTQVGKAIVKTLALLLEADHDTSYFLGQGFSYHFRVSKCTPHFLHFPFTNE